MKVIEKFCFPLKKSINGYMDIQMHFCYFYLFLFEKSSLKYHFALLISHFSLRQGICKVMIVKITKDQALGVPFWNCNFLHAFPPGKLS